MPEPVQPPHSRDPGFLVWSTGDAEQKGGLGDEGRGGEGRRRRGGEGRRRRGGEGRGGEEER